MATYDNLPVYKVSYDLLQKLFLIVRNFKRDYKHTLGETIKKEVIDLIISIYRANSHQEKSTYLEQARSHLEVVRLLIRLCKDLREIDLKDFVVINQMIESISKQLVGWERSVSKKN
ncbi:MAG TPA: four helix bundle protein [Candidatus Absconditabacterales bacterium]|nr:four helix bundle protein [Candidatus Absconditabacterales bacterium]